MNWLVKKDYPKQEKYLNPPKGRLDADIVYTKEEAHQFNTEKEATDFLYTTTFVDKGYKAIQIK